MISFLGGSQITRRTGTSIDIYNLSRRSMDEPLWNALSIATLHFSKPSAKLAITHKSLTLLRLRD